MKKTFLSALMIIIIAGMATTSVMATPVSADYLDDIEEEIMSEMLGAAEDTLGCPFWATPITMEIYDWYDNGGWAPTYYG